MLTAQPTSKLRTALSCFLAGLLLGALAFSFTWQTGYPKDTLLFVVGILVVMFVLRYALPLRGINWPAWIGAAAGIAIAMALPTLSLSSLGTEQLLLVLGILWLIKT